MEKTVISVAVVGVGPMKVQNPVPSYISKEIAGATTECCKAGTAITRTHVRDSVTRIVSSRFEIFKEVVD